MLLNQQRERGMRSALTARTWEEGFPTGNGAMGALVYGGPEVHTILLNHEELFLPLPENAEPFIPDMADCLPHVRELLRLGRSGEASSWFRERMIGRGFPKDLVWTDPFHPAFQLEVRFEERDAAHPAGAAYYLRELDFTTGEVRISWESGGGTSVSGRHVLRLFVSRTDGAVVMSIRGPAGSTIGISIQETPGAKLLSRVDKGAENGRLFFRARYEAGDGGYEGLARVEAAGGRTACAGASVGVFNAEEVLVLAEVEPFTGRGERAGALQTRLEGLPADYGSLLERHASVHGGLFGRISVDLGGGADRGRTNEDLLLEARERGPSPALVERAHDFGRFALIASSGKLPPNLQGVWNGNWSPPWSSDYTLDENLQMMMWQALPGGLPEAAESAAALIEGFLDDWRKNARLYYGCRGILSCPRASRSGLLRHLSVEYPLEFWTAGAGWLAQIFWDLWLFSGDRELLRRRVVPYLREVAAFYRDFACRSEEGVLELNPSYSPENTPLDRDNAASINATMDIAVAREVITRLLEACGVLGLRDPEEEDWRGLLASLPPYRVNPDGSLAEWAHPLFADNVRHRHSSHLYPLFPGFEAFEDPALYEACRAAAGLRFTDGIQAVTGWGLAHLANAAARLRDGGLVWAAVSRIMALFTLDNMFTTHNRRELFQLDAAMGLSAALLEMLVISRPGTLELLPALPARLPRGSLRGVRCRGALTLESMDWEFAGGNGKGRVEFTLRADAGQSLKIVLPGREILASLEAGCPYGGSIALG